MLAAIRRLTVGSRSLNPVEKFLVALTTALAVATLALAVATSARAGPAGALPGEGPYLSGPATAISHSEGAPIDSAANP